MSEAEAGVVEIQRFVSQTLMVIAPENEATVLEGLAYVWQKNNQWSAELTATVIAMLLGNVSPTFEKPPHEEELRNSPF
jgi:hypothetical protein